MVVQKQVTAKMVKLCSCGLQPKLFRAESGQACILHTISRRPITGNGGKMPVLKIIVSKWMTEKGNQNHIGLSQMVGAAVLQTPSQ